MKSTINLGYVIFLSVVAAIGGFLFGYDTAVISGTISSVKVQFGLNSIQLGWYVGCALAGSIGGVVFAGALSDSIGRKKTMLLAAVLFSISGFGCAISQTFNELVLYRIVGGVGIGVASIICPLYISELAVAKYRGSLVSLYQLAITMGFVGAYLVNYQLLNFSLSVDSLSIPFFDKVFISEAWRGMLAMESLPAIVFFIIIFFIPESPRWLVSKNRIAEATGIFSNIYCSDTEVKSQVAATESVSKSDGKSDWRLLLKPGIFRAVIIGVLIAILGQFMGVNAVL
ncbi:MAG: MFS transporter, partial [Muribaculaceae bacterium]